VASGISPVSKFQVMATQIRALKTRIGSALLCAALSIIAHGLQGCGIFNAEAMMADDENENPKCFTMPEAQSSCSKSKSPWLQVMQVDSIESHSALRHDAEAQTSVLVSNGADNGLRRRLNTAQCTIPKDPNLQYDAAQAASAITSAGANCQPNMCSEPSEDLIQTYTGNCLYAGLNSALRAGSGESFEKFETYAEYLETALMNRPGEQPPGDILYRGQSWEPQVPIYPVGSIYMLKGFTSASMCRHVAIGFASNKCQAGPVFRITTKSQTAAKPIYQLSRYPNEWEYLFPACSCFRLDGFERTSDGWQERTWYNVTEVDCPSS